MKDKSKIILNLKAFILDESASEGEQQNAIIILKQLSIKGYNVGIIPKPVRPIILKVRKKENIDIVNAIKVISVLRTTYKYGYLYKKYPNQRIKNIGKIPLEPIAEFGEMKTIEVETETYYKTKYFLYKLEYVGIDKIDIVTRKIMKKGERHLLENILIEESNNPIGNIEWDKDAINEYIDNSKMFISDIEVN